MVHSSNIPKGPTAMLYQKGPYPCYTKRADIYVIPKGPTTLLYQRPTALLYQRPTVLLQQKGTLLCYTNTGLLICHTKRAYYSVIIKEAADLSYLLLCYTKQSPLLCHTKMLTVLSYNNWFCHIKMSISSVIQK